MPSFADLSGKRFGRWEVLARDLAIGKTAWFCRCDCGQERSVRSGHLQSGASQSCGCLHKERAAAAKRTHGLSKTSIYRIWGAIRTRCYNPRGISYPIYGARGIKMCARWRGSFEAFFADMGERPSPRHSIERINNEGNYEPGNCRWATQVEQMNNCRANRRISYGGESLTLVQWARRTGLKREAIADRLNRGWPVETALTKAAKTTSMPTGPRS